MTVKECILAMLEDAEISRKELAQTVNTSEPGLTNALNNQYGMTMKVQNLMNYAASMGYQLFLRKDDKEMIIDGKTELSTDKKTGFEHISSSANHLTKPGEPLPAAILALRSEREKQADELLKDYFVRHKEVDMSAELHRIWPDDTQMYNYYMFRYRDTKERTAQRKVAFV